MFSTKGPVCLAFGEENDLYYTEDLLQLNLQQYLWMRLHGENYAAVYFLRKKNDDFEITTFGDIDRQLPTNGFSLWRSITNILTAQKFWEQMLKWTRQGAAVVCPLNDFCQVVEHAGMPRRPSEELNRKGIFVLTASIYAEQNAKSLLQSSAFSEEKLNFKPLLEVRSASEQGLYESLNERNCCVFLNTPTRENLRPILQRILLEHPGRMAACPDLDRMADQLAHCLRETAPGHGLKKLRALGSPVRYAAFRDIYRCLQDQTEWNDLLTVSQQEPLREEARAPESILREPDGWAARCLALRMPQEAALDAMLRNYAEEGLKQIHRLAASPRNRMENPRIIAAVTHFLTEASTAWNAWDWDTYSRVLYAVGVCLGKISTEENGEESDAILKIVEMLNMNIGLSSQYYQTKRTLRDGEKTLDLNSHLSQVHLQKLRCSVELEEKQLRIYGSRIPEVVLSFSLHSTLLSARALNQELEQKLEEMTEEVHHLKEVVEEEPPEPEQDELLEGPIQIEYQL